MTDGRTFLRNSTWNFLGLVVPLALAVVTIPVLIRGLGNERFGVLTLAWAAIGYFNLFELGLSRALTQAVAQRLGAGKADSLPEIVWPALSLLVALGVLGALVLAALARVLVTRLLNVPVELQQETVLSFYIVAASLPLVLMAAGLRGIIEAHQHFGLVNALRVPLMAFMFIGPLLTLPFSHSLVPAVSMLFAGRALGLVAHTVACLRRYDCLRHVGRVQWSALGPLLRFGAWTTVTGIVSPLMVQMDRFFIAAALPLAAVTDYVTPFELVTKLMIIPGAIQAAAFPAFAATHGINAERHATLYDRAQRTVVLALFPVVLVTIALAHEGLRLWLGTTLPSESATVLQWLALGIFINAVAQAPYVALQGAGRADLIAKLQTLELPVYSALLWYLTQQFGLTGVAIAWTLRVALDTTGLIVIARRVLALPTVRRDALPGMLVLTVALVAAAIPATTVVRVAYSGAVGVAFLILGWNRLLTVSERGVLATYFKSATPTG